MGLQWGIFGVRQDSVEWKGQVSRDAFASRRIQTTSMDDDDLCGVCADECVAEVMMPCQHSLCAACAAALKATHAKRVAAKCPYCSAFVERFEQASSG